MKYIRHIFSLFALAISATNPLHSAVGCMSRTQPLGKYDNKVYHHVQCNCPWPHKESRARNLCILCEHTHDVQPLTIVDPTTKKHTRISHTRKQADWPLFRQDFEHTPADSLQRFIDIYGPASRTPHSF